MQGFLNTYAGTIAFTLGAIIVIVSLALPLIINSAMLSSKDISARQKIIIYIKFFQLFITAPIPLYMFWLYFNDPTIVKSLFKLFIIFIACFICIDSILYIVFNNDLRDLVIMMRNKGGIWKWVFSTIPQKESYILRGIIGIAASIIFISFVLTMNIQ